MSSLDGGEVAKTYVLSNIASDLSGGADFSLALIVPEGTLTPQNVSVNAQTTEVSYGFTEVGEPGLNGTSTGTFTVECNVTSGNANIVVSAQLRRINSAGVVQASSSTSSEQSGGSTGVKSFTFNSPALGTWSAGDRLRVDYVFRSTASHGNNSVDIELNTANAQVITPFANVTPATVTPTTVSRAVAIGVPTVAGAGGGSGDATLHIGFVRNDVGRSAGDELLVADLVARGHTVTDIFDTDPAPTTGYDVILITESGSGSTTGAYDTCPLPVLTFEVSWTGLRLATADATTGAAGSWTLNSHAINSTFTSPLNTNSGTTYQAATSALPAGVSAIATIGTETHTLAADTGATLTSGTAIARRAAIGFSDSKIASTTTDGFSYINAILKWLANISVGNAGVTATTIGRTVSIGVPTVAAPNPNATVTPTTASRTVVIGTPSVSSGVILPGLIDGVEPEAAGGYPGPCIDSNGAMYRVTEEYLQAGGAGFGNHPMIMKSSDGGQTWTRQDATNTPGYGTTGSYNDMESACLISRPTSKEVVLCYMKSQSRWWGMSFRTSDHPTNPDTWDLSTIATSSGQDSISSQASESGVQGVTLSNGTVRAFIRTHNGSFDDFLHRTKVTTTWDTGATYISDAFQMTRPQAVVANNDITYLFYKDHTNGRIYYRTISATGTVGASTRVDSGGAGTGVDYENNCMPPTYYDDAGTPVVTVAFVNASNQLRTVDVRGGAVQAEQQVSTDTVTVNPAGTESTSDSQGPSAALAASGTTLYVFWGDNTSGDLYYATRENGGSWSARTLLADSGAGGRMNWLYAKELTKPSGSKVIGYTYDVGPHADDDSNIWYNEMAVAPTSTNATITPTSVSRMVIIGSPTTTGARPATIAATSVSRTVAIGTPTTVGTQSATITATTTSRMVTIGTATGTTGSGAAVTPTTISRLATIGASTVTAARSASVAPTAVGRTIAIGSPTITAGSAPPVTNLLAPYSPSMYPAIGTDATFPNTTATLHTDGGFDGTNYVTLENAGSATLNYNSGKVAVTAGATYSASGWVRLRSGTAHTCQAQIQFYDNTNAIIATDAGTATTPVSGSWTQATNLAVVAPAGAVEARMHFIYTSTVTGDAIDLDALQIESGSTVPTFQPTEAGGGVGVGATVGATSVSRAVTVGAPTTSATVGPTTIVATTVTGVASIGVPTATVPIVSDWSDSITATTNAVVNATATPSTLSRTVTVNTLTLIAGTSVITVPTTLARSVVVGSATIHGAASTTPTTVSRQTTISSPAVVTGLGTVIPTETVSHTVSVGTPTVAGAQSAVVAASTVVHTIEVASPAIITGGGATPSPSTVTRTVTTPTPTKSAGAKFVLAAAITGIVAVGGATISSGAGSTPSPVTVTRSVSVGSPSIAAAGNVVASPATVMGSVTFPIDTLGSSVKGTPSTVTRVASINTPVVSVSEGVPAATVSRAVAIPQAQAKVSYLVNATTIIRVVTVPTATIQYSSAVAPATILGTVLISSPGEMDWAYNPQANIIDETVEAFAPLANIVNSDAKADIIDDTGLTATFNGTANIVNKEAAANILGNSYSADIVNGNVASADILSL